MLQKIIGILLLSISGLLFLPYAYTLYIAIAVPIQKTGDTAYDTGQVIGKFVFILLFSLLLFFMIRYGLKMLKSKEGKPSIEDIGKHE